MKIYLVMPVRNSDPTTRRVAYEAVAHWESLGHQVHFPLRDAPQDCPTGERICEAHLRAMRECHQVRVLWDEDSKGSHFDIGMAYALGKPIFKTGNVGRIPPEKSYWNAVMLEPEEF